MKSKLVSTKNTSAIFLTIVLVTGTIAAISPLFNIKGVNAQGDPHYGMDRFDVRKSYGNDYGYESQYQQPSYKPDYKPKYPSYGKDDRDKSKKDDSSKSVSLNKLKCINVNININGNNTGDVNIGNKGQGYLGANSYSDEGYYNGLSKQGKDFDCVINNNNINLVSDGNQTEQLTCEECFTENLSAEQLNNITIALSVSSRLCNLEGLCEQLSTNTTLTNIDKLVGLRALFDNASITDVDAILRVLECLEELRLIIVPPNFDPIVD